MLKRGIGVTLHGVRAWTFTLFAWMTCCAGTGDVAAATLSWSGGGGGNANWNNSANWGFAGTPANGDTLIFPAGQPNAINTNNLAGLTLNQIRFAGAGGGYSIRGNAFTLTNSIAATNTAGVNVISNNITLATATLNVNVGSGATLNLANALSGSMGLTKTGAGTLIYSSASANSYGGATAVNDGDLLLAKTSFNVSIVNSSLTIGDGVGAIGSAMVQDVGMSQIGSVPVTINGDGLLDLNGIGEAIGNSLTLNDGGDVTTGGGTFSLTAANPTITVNPGGGLLQGSSISGLIGIGSGSTCTISVSSSAPFANGLTITADVIGGNNLTKIGSGPLTLSGGNGYLGVTTISNGFVNVGSATALGNTAAGTVLSGGHMLIQGVTVANEWLTNNSALSQLQALGASASGWSSNIVLNADLDVDVFTTGTLDFSGVISGTAGINKRQTGTLTFSGPGSNSHLGNTTVSDGELELSKTGVAIPSGTLTIGDGVGGEDTAIVRELAPGFQIGSIPIILNADGLLDLNGQTDTVGALTFNGGDITTGVGTLQMGGNASAPATSTNVSTVTGRLNLVSTRTFDVSGATIFPEILISANVLGAGAGIIKNGEGDILMNASNSFGGLATVNDGALLVEDDFALGTTNGGAVVNTGGRLLVRNNTHVGGESITVNGGGPFGTGAFGGVFGTNSWAGSVTLNTDSVITASSSSSDAFLITGAIGGSGTLTKRGPGKLVYDGTAVNTYTNTTAVNEGTLVLRKSTPNASVQGPLVIGDGVGGANADVVRCEVTFQIENDAPMIINSSGRYEENSTGEAVGSIEGSGNISIDFLLIAGGNNASTTFSGIISGGSLFSKNGTGTLNLTGNNTFIGEMSINEGTLLVNGSQPGASISVAGIGILGGSGTVRDINNSSGGVVTPGNSPGMLTSSNVFFSGAISDFTVELNGTAAGTGYDQLNVRGTNNLGGATLNVNAAFSLADAPAAGDTFVILNNDGVDPIAGTFAGRPDNSVFIVDALNFRIDYDGGTGNDVVLTLTNVPAAQFGAVGVSSGDGNGTVDPNECNLISIVVSNRTASVMTGITATLSSLTAGATVIGSISSFPDIPAFSRRTNTTPFQISTAPFFTCGDNIELQLALQTATHNAFSIPVILPTGTPGAPVAFSNSTPAAIPDGATLDSTLLVSGLTEPIGKAVVSLHVTYPQDQDLDITLEAPDGTLVELTTDNGSTGGNYGTSCAARTTFDDAAATPITSGSAPFTGTFRPEGRLTDFRGMSSALANGTWTLHVTDDSFNGFSGTLQCWTLNLSPATCSAGSGACENCPDVTLHGALGPASPLQSDRLIRDGAPSVCGFLKGCPGPIFHGSQAHDAYEFRNGSSNACITVMLVAPVSDFFSAAYSNSFNPADLCTNHIADSGNSTEFLGPSVPVSYSFDVAADATFVVTVNGVDGSQSGPYSLTVSGGDCRPVLDIASAAADKVLLDWTTAAAGYRLERTNSLSSGTPGWLLVTNIPVVINSRFHVTNNIVETNRFYWLRKPLP